MRLNLFHISVVAVLACLFTACTTTKYVPDGSYLLDNVHIVSDNKDVNPSDLNIYVRQQPNSKLFSLFKTQLYLYDLSGRDSTKWMNKVLRRMGDAPVIYSEQEAERSRQELTKAVQNLGYMRAHVSSNATTKKKKLRLTYDIHTGNPYQVRHLRYNLPDTLIAAYVKQDSAHAILHEGMLFDVNKLDKERQRVSNILRRHGYFKFNKDFISYTADTVRNTYKVDLTMHLKPFRQGRDTLEHRRYLIDRVSFVTDYNVMQSSIGGDFEASDSIVYREYPIYFKDNLYLRPKVLESNLRMRPGQWYNEQDVQRTYLNFGRLSALRYTNIRFDEVQHGDTALLSAYVMLTKNRPRSVSFEIEGTNSAGDLGAAASVSFQNRNLFKGSEAFTFKVRGAYEAVSGLQGYYHDEDYTELGAETSLNFPRFMFPFLSRNYRNRIRANTVFGLQYNYQRRPEFSRIVASASWSYRWGVRQSIRHQFDLLDIDYLYMPWIDGNFENQYLNQRQNYILKYNFEDRLIVRMGYNYVYNSAGQELLNNSPIGNSYTIRFNIESAGNLLYTFAAATKMKRNEEGEYVLLNIPFAQYMKGDFDFAKNVAIDKRNSVAFHAGMGIAVPYGNADMIPFEKRYFSGGANSVRGWSVRSLGPGSFAGDGNFLNQTGDLKLDGSLEYRTRLFWKLHGAAFVDAGNIWTLRAYDSQPGGQFKLNKFYKQIAMAYGLGIRLDLEFFILRFDGGMKAVNPVYENGRDRYPITHPSMGRDFAFHFAVGYPF